jgi:hypothetical protein
MLILMNPIVIRFLSALMNFEIPRYNLLEFFVILRPGHQEFVLFHL